jgi:hypothetical protein
MKWLEIIKVRSVEKGAGLMEALRTPMTGEDQSGPVEVTIFRHAGLETDWSMHLHWSSPLPEQNGSTLGLRLAQAFEEFGLVHHSVWIQNGIRERRRA